MTQLNAVIPLPPTLHDQFLGLKPMIERYAKRVFRQVTCSVTRDDLVSETLALAWTWFVRLWGRKDVSEFSHAFAALAVRAVRSGRRAARSERTGDVFSGRAQRRHGFRVVSMSSVDPASRSGGQVGARAADRRDPVGERLSDNTTTPVPDQAAFRIDFRAWRQSLTPRERDLTDHMAADERTQDLARMFHVSPGRISQYRRTFERSWREFCAK